MTSFAATGLLALLAVAVFALRFRYLLRHADTGARPRLAGMYWPDQDREAERIHGDLFAVQSFAPRR